MKAGISSRERTLAAINHQEADRVPIHFRGVAPFDHLWKSEHERVDVLLDMGADAYVNIAIEPSLHPDVTVRDWFDEESDPEYRLACREYTTPAGTLRAVMRCTEDCTYEGGVPLASDHNISRGVEFLVKGRDDLPKLAYLLQEPSNDDIAAFRDQARRQKEFAAHREIVVIARGGPAGDMAFWLCGPNLYYLVQDDPEFAQTLLDMIQIIDLKCMHIVLDEAPDIVYTRGCYETAPLWSPQFHDMLFAPRLRERAELVHQAGAKLSYFSSGNFVPHVEALLDTGADIIDAVRPYDGANDMRALKERIGGRICLWGGINPEVSIARATPEQTRRDVADVILAAAVGGGFVLSTGGSIFDTDCYENTVAFIEAAREFGTYPIDVPRLEAVIQP